MGKINNRLFDYYIDNLAEMNLLKLESNSSSFINLFCNKFRMNKKQKETLTILSNQITENFDNATFDPKSVFDIKKFNDLESKESEFIQEIDLFPMMVDSFLNNGLDLINRTIYMNFPVIDEESANDFIKKLYVLEHLSEQKITIFINSRGGDTYSGLAMIDAMQSLKSPITMVVFGRCMSMGAWILQFAKTRVISKNARFMIHKGSVGMGVMHPEDNKAWITQYAEDEVLFNKMLLERIKEKFGNKTLANLKQFLIHRKPNEENQIKGIANDIEAINKMIEFDLILDADETIEIGLADMKLESLKDV